jgi:putative SOS response-associated peptidase YedK
LALDESRPQFFFAGIWRPFFGERKQESVEHLVSAFFTTEPNAVVGQCIKNSMPLIFNSKEARETWLTGSAKDALALQHPTSDDALRIVATGKKEDGA